MKKEQTMIAVMGSNLSNIAILAGFLLAPAACLDGTAQPGADMGGATELPDQAVTALSDDQEALPGADGDPSSAEAPPVVANPGFLIRSDMNNKCLEVLGLDIANGAHVVMWDCWGGANQRWYWDGRQIRSDLNNKCLEILGLNNDNGAHAGMWDCWGGANQHWYQE